MRASHPDQAELVGRIEQGLARILSGDPSAILNEELLGVPPRDYERTRTLLLELVAARVLKLLFVWRCPNGNGTTWEAEALASLPDSVECDRCGDRHWLSEDDVEVHFVATRGLTDALQVLRT